MSISIPQHHVEMYRSNVIMLAQQKGARLIGTCRNDGEIVGRTAYYERLGKTAAQQVTTRHADTPLANSPHTRRRAEMTDWDWADLIDSIDRIRTLYDPTNPYAQNGAWAIGRSIDDVIILAANGNAYEGQSGGTVTPLPVAQQVAVAATGMTLVKLLEAKERLDGADVDPEIPRYCAMKSGQFTDLLNTVEVKSSDYNTVKALVQGQIDTFLGFKFIRSERLTVDGSGNVLVLAYTGAAIGIGMGQDLMVDIGPRRDKRNATQVYVCASLAATRIEDEQLVQIACLP